MGDEKYPAYCRECDYDWMSKSSRKPPKCPECQSSRSVVYSQLDEEKLERGKELLESVSEDSEIYKATRDAVEFGTEFVDWDEIERVDPKYTNKVVVFRFTDTGRMVAMRTVKRGIEVMSEEDVKRYIADQTNPIEADIEMKESLGRDIMSGKYSPQRIRYQFQDELNITTTEGHENAVWYSCMGVFNYFYMARQTINREDELRDIVEGV